MKALITGGNGDISKAIQKRLLELDYQILAPTRQEMDVTNKEQIIRVMNSFKPDIIINAAGYISPASIKESDDEEWIKHFDVNVYGAYLCIKYALLNGCSTVINIGSTSSFEGRENWGAYCATKAALMSLTETLAREGINSYAIHPSRTKTKMRDNLFPNEDKTTLMDPDRVAQFVIRTLDKEFSNGCHIIVKKDRYYVFPMREVVK